jgi:hypothetical protein
MPHSIALAHPEETPQAGPPAPPSSLAPPASFSAWILATWILVTLAGFALRQLAWSLESSLVATLAGMLLFLPFSLGTLWISWRPKISVPTGLGLIGIAAATFGVWNAIMLDGQIEVHARALRWNVLHWGLFLLLGFASARFLHWSVGLGLWHPSDPAPTRLTVRRLLLSTSFIALLAVACQFWISQDPAWQFAYPAAFETQRPWYAWLPMASKPWFSGAVGGLLLGIQWGAVAWVLRAGRFRLAGLFAWIAIATFVRAATDQIYWGPPPWANLTSDSVWAIDSNFLTSASQPLRGTLWVKWLVEAATHTALQIAAIAWLARFGYRVGPRRSAKQLIPPRTESEEKGPLP